MSNVLHSRFFRLLVCLILVATFLVNLSPLKAEATAVVGTLLTFEGLMAALFSMSIGVVAVDLTVETWNKIGQGLGQEIEKADPSVLEVWVDVEAAYEAYGPDGPDDPEDALEWAEKLKHALSRGLLASIAGWLCSLVKMGGYEVEEESISNAFAYYNQHYLPVIPSRESHPNAAIFYCPLESLYVCHLTNGSFYVPDSAKSGSFAITGSNFKYYKYILQNNSWVVYQSDTGMGFFNIYGTKENFINTYQNMVFVWSNSSFDGFLASDPTQTKIEIVEPSIYVGDIPDQIQNGDKDENNLDLPIVDPFRFIQSPGTAYDDVNQMQQQLANGTTTLDQYLDHITYQEPTVNPDPDPSSPTSPSTGTDTEWQPPEDPGKFALNLTDVFPFCIPFDLYDFLTCLNADPVTPVINWEIAMPGGGSYPLTIDLSPFDSVAQLLRRLELLLFCVGLAIKTRDLIKG